MESSTEKKIILLLLHTIMVSKNDANPDTILNYIDEVVANIKADFITSYNFGFIKPETRIKIELCVETEKSDIAAKPEKLEEYEKARKEILKQYMPKK